MEKKILGHIAGFGTLRDMERLEQDYYGEFTDAGMSELLIKEELTTKECDRLSEELSGKVVVIKKKPSK
ncbi:hypothetical protein [Oceanobacillus jordanicus]|uniref:Uncharacterized protein n=1 Tax=Oceanobacillus jordanicus TaxID=2867266 RepID=A0AAW5B4N1_9BACI|nr:hypothetical protein [Oceanobacillus jordanicus]MCG3418948.1 hypothetical protein [Oceanobacillus jordanicus]